MNIKKLSLTCSAVALCLGVLPHTAVHAASKTEKNRSSVQVQKDIEKQEKLQLKLKRDSEKFQKKGDRKKVKELQKSLKESEKTEKQLRLEKDKCLGKEHSNLEQKISEVTAALDQWNLALSTLQAQFPTPTPEINLIIEDAKDHIAKLQKKLANLQHAYDENKKQDDDNEQELED